MKSFSNFITESRSAPLYHGTNISSAEEILKHNMIMAKTGHQAPALGLTRGHALGNYKNTGGRWGDINGVSLTRSFKTAMDFGAVIFELDQSVLTNNHKIVPIQYFGIGGNAMAGARSTAYQAGKGKSGASTEAEEFVIGSIKNLDKYLKTIWVPNGAAVGGQWRTWDDVEIPLSDDYNTLRNHPKAKLYKHSVSDWR